MAEKVTNQLLDKTARKISEEGKTVHVMDIKTLDYDIPNGFYYSIMNIEKIIRETTAFKVVGAKDKPDYILEPKIAKIYVNNEPQDYQTRLYQLYTDTANVTDVIYQLYLGLYDNDGNLIEATSDGYRQIFEDNSWW